jgi:uncharacterized membrane protein
MIVNPPGQAFRWSLAEGKVLLPNLPTAAWARARAISNDGAIVVGSSGSAAALWVLANKQWTVVDLDATYSHPSGWTLSIATGVSGDGRFVVGNASTPTGTRGFVIDRGAPH